MIPLFPGSGGLLLTLLMATLPALISIQVTETLVSSARRRQSVASPRDASVRGLIKALNLHPLTISATIELTAQDFPRLTVVRHIPVSEVNSIANWIHEDRIQTLESIYILKSEAIQ